MNKEEFLKKLRKKLDILEESEIEDIINEYDGYIEEKKEKGSTEKEAVKSMGNVDELAKELLSAYKVKATEGKNDAINNLANEFVKAFEYIIDVFSHKSFSDILKFILEIVAIFLIIAVCKIPFGIIESIGVNAFSSFGKLYPGLKNLWHFIIEFSYLVFAVLLFIKIFESRYLNDFKESISLNKTKDKVVSKKKDKEKASEVVSEKNKTVVDILADIFLIFTKIIAFFIMLGAMCYIIGMSIVLILSIYLIIKGICYYGIYLIFLALFTLGVIAFIFLFNFIFERKSKVGILLISTLGALIVLGSGVAISAIEFSQTSIVYDNLEDGMIIEDFVDMKDNLVLFDDIIVDDDLEDKIKIEYKYNDKFIKLEGKTHTEEDNNYFIVTTDYNLNQVEYKKEYFEEFLDNLKNKKLFINNLMVETKVYASSEVKEKIMNNNASYEKINYDDNDIEDLCNEIDELGGKLPDICQEY